MPQQVDWYVGIDWGYDAHQVCVLNATRDVIEQRRVRHEPEALVTALDWIATLTRTPPSAIAVAIERPHGAVVELLLDRGYAVFALNPKQLDRFRDRFTAAGAKDDRRDAEVLADSLRTDRWAFTLVQAHDARLVQLQTLARTEQDLKQDLSRLTNRLREQIYRVAPAVARLAPAADEPWFWTLVEQAATPAAQRALTPTEVRTILKTHRIRRLTAETVLTALRAPLWPLAPGVAEAAADAIAILVAQLRVTDAQRRRCVARQEALLTALHDAPAPSDPREHRDVEILASLPGLGRTGTVTMLTEAAAALAARDYHRLRAHTGSAPLTSASGKRRVVRMRRACNPRLRQAVYHWTRVSLQRDGAARAYYDRLRARGHSHARSLRSLADRWLRILIAMLTHRTLYVPQPMAADTVAAG
jgi:transposase